MRQGIAKNKDIGMKNMKKQLKQTYQLGLSSKVCKFF